MLFRTFAFLLATVLMVGGCESVGPKQGVGTLGGAALGGLLGSQFGSGSGKLAATGLGVLLGGLVGSEIGRGLDRQDQIYAERANAQAYAAPIGQPIQWNNPQTGNRGVITPVNDGYNTQTGAYCREFQQTIYVGGRSEQGHGVACRQPDGSWRIQG